jgi:hypothetical protein
MRRLVLFVVTLLASFHALGQGYSVGNFGISARITESDSVDAQIRINPPKLGQWLEEFAHGNLWIEGTDGVMARRSLRPTGVSRTYPEYSARFEAPEGLTVQIEAYAPLALHSEIGFLPVLIFETTLTADRAWNGKVGYTLTPKHAEPAPAKTLMESGVAALVGASAFLAMSGASSRETHLDRMADALTVSVRIQIQSGGQRKLTFIVGAFDDNGRYANKYSSAERLLRGVIQQAPALANQLREFTDSLPRTGDATLDRYLRWYASAAILLTKGVRSGEVLTMGYRELNQRDSFFSSGIHLVFWQDLERQMILETIAGQLPNGRIPVCLLPLIDRGDELDSTEYFVLRVARYYRWYRDDRLLARAWPAVKKGIDYLASRDRENVGVPMQTSFWADWKDVRGVEGRTYAPHIALLWVAALEGASTLAAAAGDDQASATYERLKERAEAFINLPFEQGGLWSGGRYVDRWKDGRRPQYVLMDQTIGAYFGVIPGERLASIYEHLEPSETRFGVRETFPYIDSFDRDFGPGEYHNGGIWPWINFMDSAGRFAHGYAADAERIIREVGYADLEAEGDYQPGEYLHGESGRNLGFPIQAWDAALFSTIYFGAFGLERISDSEIHIRVRTPKARDFATRLLLPGAPGTLSNRAGVLCWRADPAHDVKRKPLVIRVFDERQRPASALSASSSTNVGSTIECEAR